MTRTPLSQTLDESDWQRGYEAGFSGCTRYSSETLAFASGFIEGRLGRDRVDDGLSIPVKKGWCKTSNAIRF